VFGKNAFLRRGAKKKALRTVLGERSIELCFSKMMMDKANFLVLDEPNNT